MDEKKLTEMVMDALNEADDRELLDIYNDYADKERYENIWPMSEFDELVGHEATPSWVIDHCDDGFSTNHDYFYVDGLGYYCSGSAGECVEANITLGELADWIVRNDYIYKYDCLSEVQEKVDEYETFTSEDFSDVWDELEDVLFDEKDGEMVLADDWRIYEKGTSRETIWHSLEEIFGESIGDWLNGNKSEE